MGTELKRQRAGAPAVEQDERRAQASAEQTTAGSAAAWQRSDMLSPGSLMQLQRTMGNRAVQRLVAQQRAGRPQPAAPASIQRMVYAPQPKAIVTTNGWLDKVKATAKEDYDEAEVRDALGSYLGQTVDRIVPKFKQDHEISTTYQALDVGSRPYFVDRVNDEGSIYTVKPNFRENTSTKLLLDPDLIWTGANDLREVVNPDYACVLISLLKVLGYDTLKAELGLEAAVGESNQVKAMHKKLYTEQKIRYDEWSGHLPLYQKLGLTLHPIRTTWGNLHKRLDLRPGKYVLGLSAHMMALQVTADLTGKKNQDGEAGWYNVYSSTFQPSYKREFDPTEQIEYLFSA